MRQRDTILLVYLAASGTLFDVGFGASKPPEILLVVPVLAVGCAILVAHHTLVIGDLFEYCYFELSPYLGNKPPNFERSIVMEQHRETTIWLKPTGHAILLASPCFAALLFNPAGSTDIVEKIVRKLYRFGADVSADALAPGRSVEHEG